MRNLRRASAALPKSERRLQFYFAGAVALIVMLFIGIVVGVTIAPPETGNNLHRVMTIAPPPSASTQSLDADTIAVSTLLTERWLAWISLMMLGVTSVGVALLYLTLRETGAMLVEAQLATDAAISTAETTRLVGQLQTRAYLQVDEVFLHTGAIDNGLFPFTVRFRLKNSGNSPGRAIALRCATVLQESDLADLKVGQPYASLQHVPVKFELVPGNEFIGTFHGKMTPGQWAQVQSRSGDLIVWGIVRYRDVFGSKRAISFCFKTEINYPGALQPWQLSIFGRHNKSH